MHRLRLPLQLQDRLVRLAGSKRYLRPGLSYGSFVRLLDVLEARIRLVFSYQVQSKLGSTRASVLKTSVVNQRSVALVARDKAHITCLLQCFHSCYINKLWSRHWDNYIAAQKRDIHAC